jgi:glycosyltransferase involved in cell wall biosynthesis
MYIHNMSDQLLAEIPNKQLITFIIPTIGRSTLSNTLDCLIKQTIPNWKAIVIFDGISSTIQPTDPRIRIIESPKLGQGHNSAGLVRNYGITFADTEWVAFVDDDDSLSNNYVEILLKESGVYALADIIIFRMVNNFGIISPILSTDTFFVCDVGISFAVKKKLFDEGHVFIPSNIEDFCYLDEARNKKYNIMISPYVTYFVNKYEQPECPELGNRVCLFT